MKETQSNESKLKETTLGELGCKLAIGTSGQGPDKLNKALVLGEMTTADEKAIARRTKGGVTMGEHVAIVLAQMVRQLGEYNLVDKSFEERLIQINRLYMGDVLVAYIWLRIDNMGQYLNLEARCRCSPKKTLNIKADLKTIKVVTADSEADMVWHFKLQKPITHREKKVESFTMTTPRWTTIAGIGDGGVTLSVIEGLRSGIIGINGQQDPSFIFSESDFETLKKVDLMNLTAEIEDHVIGPHMVSEHTCPECGAESRSQLNWRYGDFFGVSSASRTKRR